MNTYYLSGTCSCSFESVIDSTFMLYSHGDGRWNTEIQASSLRSALLLLAKLIGDYDYIINPRYTVINQFGKASVRLLKNGGIK